MPFVADEDVAICVGRHANRRVELSMRVTQAAPGGEKASITGEFLDPVVAVVHHENVPIPTEGDPHGAAQLSVRGTRAAPLGNEDSVVGELLDAVVEKIRDEDGAIGTHGNANGVCKLPVPATHGAPFCQEGPRGRELLNAIIEAVGNEDAPVSVDGNGHGAAELPVAVTHATPLGEPSSGAREFLDAAIVDVGDEDVAIGIHGTPGAYLCSGAADQLDTFALVHIFGHRNQQQMAIAKLVMDGVLERFPTLRFGFLEAGCGWLPDLIHALHEHWEKRIRDFNPHYQPPMMRLAVEAVRDRNPRVRRLRRAKNLFTLARSRKPPPLEGSLDRDAYLYEHRELKRNPEEYFARGQVFTTFEPDDPAPVYLRTALGSVGEQLAGWSVDYGHWDGVLTDCVKRISENPQIDGDYGVRLLSANTLRFYGPRLRQRIEPLMRSQRLVLEPPQSPAQTVAGVVS